MNLRKIAAAALVSLSLKAGVAHAQIIASDDFSYPNGNLAGNNQGIGWNAAWIATQGNPTVAGGQVNINSSAGQQTYRELSSFQGPGSVAWVRFAGQQFTTASAGITNNTYGGLDIYNGSSELGLIGKGWPGPYRWTLAINGSTQVSTQSTLSASVLYARITTTETNVMIIDLWVNPADPSIIDTVTPNATKSFTGSGWNRIYLRGGIGTGDTESWKFDNLAIGMTLADVAVPPSPVITSEPVSVLGFPGQNISFSVEAAGNQPLGYQWQTNGVNLINAGNVTGAASNVLTITGATPANASTDYRCIVTNNLGAVTSSVVSLTISTTPAFSSQTPPVNALSVPATNGISVQIQQGNLLNTNAFTLTLDGAPVTPVITQNTNTFLTTVSFQPGSPLSLAATHVVQVRMTDKNGVSFTNAWSFRTGYPTLPVTLAGTYGPVSNSGPGLVVFRAAGEGWLGTNYNANSSRTLYTRFSMAFHDVNGEVGVGGAFGGLQFFQGDTEHLLVGNNWQAITWSLTPPDTDLFPLALVNIDEWHTIVMRTDYSANNNATVSVWLDPDFSQTEANQPNAPVVVSVDNTFDNIRLRCGEGTASASFSNIIVAATSMDVGFAAPVAPQFQSFVPGANAPSASPGTALGFQVVVGSAAIDTNDITFTLDGNNVTPDFSVSDSIITASYQPETSFIPGSFHTAMVNLIDANETPYSTIWSFTVDPYPTLPVSLEVPIQVSGGVDTTIFTSQNGWLDGNYGAASTNTIYTRFSMTFNDVNGETGSGGCYGGLEFYQGNTERVLVGNNWESTNWSLTQGSNGANPLDLTPVTPIVLNEWHTLVVKSAFASNANAIVSVWLDPDFSRSEGNQLNPPVVLSVNNTFDQIRLRCGNGTASAQFTNIVIAATAPGVGFAATVEPALLTLQTSELSWTSAGVLQSAPTVTGPWTDFENQANPQIISPTNSAMFFRIRQ